MDIEEFAPKKTPPIALGQEELARMSIEDLDLRVRALEAEIERCQSAKTAKQATRASADRYFKA
jgi:uncharacterized small protein (DUF1192 family)